MIIYKIENKINGKVYVGQTVNGLNKRILAHMRSKFQIGNALRKYGLQSFNITIIDHASNRQVLNEKEKYWIGFFNSIKPNGYNITSGGEGTDGPNTEEWKAKLRKPHGPMSEANKEIHRIAANRKEVIEHNRIINTGKTLSKEHKQNISNGLMGRIVTEETKQKLRGWERTEEYKIKLRKPCSDKRRQNIILGKQRKKLNQDGQPVWVM